MPISQSKGFITLDHETYSEIVMETFSMQDSNPSKTPVGKNFQVAEASDDEQLVDETLYSSEAASFLYIAKQTGPDRIWIVNVLYRLMQTPKICHWLAGAGARYLQATKSLKLVCPRDYVLNLHWRQYRRPFAITMTRSTTGYF